MLAVKTHHAQKAYGRAASGVSFENVTVSVMIAAARVINCFVMSAAKSNAFLDGSSLCQQCQQNGHSPGGQKKSLIF